VSEYALLLYWGSTNSSLGTFSKAFMARFDFKNLCFIRLDMILSLALAKYSSSSIILHLPLLNKGKVKR